jgi:hypothetical protein
VGFDSLQGQRSLLHSVETGSGAKSSSNQMGTSSSFSGGKAARSVKLTTHLNLVLRSRMVELDLHSSTFLRVVGAHFIKDRDNLHTAIWW